MKPDRFERGFVRQFKTSVFQILLDKGAARIDRLPPNYECGVYTTLAFTFFI